MRLALFLLLAAAAMTSASAATVPAPALSEPAELAATTTLATLAQQDAPPPRIATSAPPSARSATIQTVALTPDSGQGGQTDEQASGWEAFAPVMVTLALIGAIAVRRHKAGKS